MGFTFIPTSPLSITVAGGRQLVSVSECTGFTWQLKGETFVTDVMLLPLGGCEMVLGNINCNFKELRMEFVHNHKTLVIRVPKQLPPQRSHDHRIPLIEETDASGIGLGAMLQQNGHPIAYLNGQTEVVNRCLEGYLRCMTEEQPKEWIKWITLAELLYTSNFHSSINTTPFEVLYGQPTPLYVPYLRGGSSVEVMDKTFEGKCGGEVSAQAQLVALLDCDGEGLLIVPPLAVLDRNIMKRNNAVAMYGLIQWANDSPDDATWELIEDLLKRFPTFDIIY
nr:retrotransposable element Tf2 [Tanacetum cinerariifolium]